MSKKCARCEKTVYPIEELKCLDKVWHKPCFKCKECNMTLNMRNYKGFNKDPYCEAHIPKAKATTMAETPELKRIAENTKIQSNVKYHAEFEKAKGKVTQVTDDPETLRLRQNSKIISNVAYHGDLQKKAAMEQKRTLTGENGDVGGGPEHQLNSAHHDPPPPASQYNSGAQPQQHGGGGRAPPPQYNAPPPPAPVAATPHHHPGKISDYDPMGPNHQPRNSPYTARQSSTVIYTSDQGSVQCPPGRRIGSIADLDPVNDFYGSLAPHTNHHTSKGHGGSNHSHHRSSGRVYRAMYDYEARDRDEVSFSDGDIIVNCTPIDEGWMTGLVQRTGQTGMLPANYVEPAI